MLCNFMEDYPLVAADLNFHFTYERDDCAVCSWPDHIIWSMSIYMVNLIEDVSKFDRAVNLSDHYPLRYNFKVFCDTSPSPPSPPPSSISTSRTSRFDWARASSLDIHNLCCIIVHSCVHYRSIL